MDETYRWQHWSLDVSGLLRAIRAGTVPARPDVLDAEFIGRYVAGFTSLGRPESDGPWVLKVDQAHVRSLPAQRLAEPVLVVFVAHGEGYLSLGEQVCEPHYVVADGTHRICRAYLDGATSVPALVIGEEARPFWSEA